MSRKRKLPPGLWKRGDNYYARFRHGGRLIRKKLSSDFDAACDILTDIKARASRSDYGLTDNDFSWDDLKKEFLRWAKQALREPEAYERDLAHFERYCRVRSVRQVTQAYVIGYREWRLTQAISQHRGRKADDGGLKVVCPRTINREVATLRNMLNKGITWRRIGSNPVAELKPLRHDTPRKQRRALSAAEMQAILDASPDYLRPVFRLYACSGIRRGELVSLRFADVDFEGRCITIRASVAKSGKARTIPLDDEMLGLLTELRDKAAGRGPVAGHTPSVTAKQAATFTRDHVFVTKANTPLKNNLLDRFYAICKRAGIEGAEPGGSVDIHSLRGTFTTLAIENGASPKAVQSILGHSTLALTMGTYAKATERAKRDAVSALPFAKASSPDHIISLNQKRTDCVTATRTEPQLVTESELATGT
jgi:integrase